MIIDNILTSEEVKNYRNAVDKLFYDVPFLVMEVFSEKEPDVIINNREEYDGGRDFYIKNPAFHKYVEAIGYFMEDHAGELYIWVDNQTGDIYDYPIFYYFFRDFKYLLKDAKTILKKIEESGIPNYFQVIEDSETGEKFISDFWKCDCGTIRPDLVYECLDCLKTEGEEDTAALLDEVISVYPIVEKLIK